MPKLTIKELLKITRGKLINGQLSTSDKIKTKDICIDTRLLEKGQIFIALKGKNFDGYDFVPEAFRRGACGVIINRPLALRNITSNQIVIQVKDTVRCLGEIAGYWRRKFPIPLVAITGSNGKTTTKDMTIRILSEKFRVLSTKGSLNNHIGLPLTLLESGPQHELVCVEMGTSSFGEIAYLCKIAAPVNVGLITNIQRAHLLYFGNLDGVLKAKMELINSLSTKGVAVLNIDDGYLGRVVNKIKSKVLTYGINNPKADISAEDIQIQAEGIKFKAMLKRNGKIYTENISLPVLGYQNVYNALAGIGLGSIFGIPLKVSARRLAKFTPPHLRMEISKIKSINIINDSYNANPDSMRMAIYTLESFKTKGKKIAVLGDMLELGRTSKQAHEEIGQLIAKLDISNLFSVGKMAKYVADGAIKNGFNKAEIFIAEDKKDIIKQLLNKVKKGDVVLIKGSRAMKMEEIVEALK